MAARRGSKQTGKFLLDGTEHTIRWGSVEMVLWERANKGAPFSTDGGQHFQRIAWCIWSAAKRSKITDLSFDAWLTRVEDVWVEQDDEEDEGHQDPPDGSSPDNSSN